MDEPTKRCDYCGHSRAAHVDGARCALCGCIPERRNFVQQSLTFRSALTTRVTTASRKR